MVEGIRMYSLKVLSCLFLISSTYSSNNQVPVVRTKTPNLDPLLPL